MHCCSSVGGHIELIGVALLVGAAGIYQGKNTLSDFCYSKRSLGDAVAQIEEDIFGVMTQHHVSLLTTVLTKR